MFIEKIAEKYSTRNRLKKFNLFMDYLRPTRFTKILDVGATEREYLKSDNMIEKKYPYPENITALGVDNFQDFKTRYPKVRAIVYDGRKFPFRNKEFDLCWSNAVIEHVNVGTEREQFLQEMRRVAKFVFFTTPNRYFPFETHTKMLLLHWLPKRIFDSILITIGRQWASGNYMSLMGRKDIVNLLRRCKIEDYKIIENKIFGFTVDFVIIF